MSEVDQRTSLVESLFHQARELHLGERKAFLDKACRDDDGLRAEIDALLGCDVDDDPLFAHPGQFAGTLVTQSSPREGTMLGRYKLLEQIGEGGFGLVYMAEQVEPVRRKVALKIIKPGMDSKEVIARFEAKRQALAMMDHPNIAHVLDAGTTDAGHLYFVMELVRGVSITKYCDDNNIDMRGRLKLFQGVCRAVQHAHQKGLIHRDLKPSNVMVTLHDGVAISKVIDFGVSKALGQPLTEKTLFTRYGQVVGTPQYMSPEQAELSGKDVDTRSDIYALGVILYELLTGETPIDPTQIKQAGFAAMLSLVRESDPVKPSQRIRTLDHDTATAIASHRATQPVALSKAVSGELDWIVLKCLEKERNRRYESTSELDRDIEHYLRDEPVSAGAPTIGYRAKKFVRRNGIAVSVGTAAVSLFLFAFVLVTSAWLQTKAAQQQTELAQKAAVEAAEEARQEATRAQDSLQILADLIGSAKPRGNRGADIPVSEFLALFAEQVDATAFQDAEVEMEVRSTLGRTFCNFSLFEDAESQINQVIGLARKTYARDERKLAVLLVDLVSSIQRWEILGDKVKVELLDEAKEVLKQEPDLVTHRIQALAVMGEICRLEPEVSEMYGRQACQLADQLSQQQLATLPTNPYSKFVPSLARAGKRKETQEAIEKAVDLATLMGDRKETLQLCRRKAQFEKNIDEVVGITTQLYELAVETKDHELLLDLIQERMERECQSITPETLEVAREFSDQLLQLEDPHATFDARAFGNVAGPIITLDGPEAAADLMQIIEARPNKDRALAGGPNRHLAAGAGRDETVGRRFQRSRPAPIQSFPAWSILEPDPHGQSLLRCKRFGQCHPDV